MNTIPTTARNAAVVVAIGAALVLGFGPRAQAATVVAPAPTTVASVGDSISDWHRLNNFSTYSQTQPITRPWTTDLTGSVQLTKDDGWAVSGTTLEQQAVFVRPIHSNVLVLMSGTNDLGTLGRLKGVNAPIGTITAQPVMVASVFKILAEANAPKCILAAIAPSNLNPVGTAAWNVELRTLAVQAGCKFIDPWTAIRNADNTFVAGWTFDGVHPNDAGSMLAANQISLAVQSLR